MLMHIFLVKAVMLVLINFAFCLVAGAAAHAMAERALSARGIGVFNIRVRHFRSVARAYSVPKQLRKGEFSGFRLKRA